MEKLNEDVLGFIPDFVFRSAIDKFCEDIRKQVLAFILQYRSMSAQQRREALTTLDAVLKDLNSDTYSLLSDKLWMFMNDV
jgi:hypothetical protein